MAGETQKIIDLAFKFTGHISLKALMREMNACLPSYFEFSDVNCMFLDPEIDELYTITFGDDEERVQNLEIAIKKATTETDK